MVGEIDQAKKSLLNYHRILKKYGFLPEFYDIQSDEAKRVEYPLRPELIESLFYLYRATKDPLLQTIAADIIESLDHSAKTECGYATIKNVVDHTIEDRMESFFLSETLKYLYLMFDTDNSFYNYGSKGSIVNGCLMDAGGYVFNTEAHPIDAAAIDCCNRVHFRKKFSEQVDLYSSLMNRKKTNRKSKFPAESVSSNGDTDGHKAYSQSKTTLPDDQESDIPPEVNSYEFLVDSDIETIENKSSKFSSSPESIHKNHETFGFASDNRNYESENCSNLLLSMTYVVSLMDENLDNSWFSKLLHSINTSVPSHENLMCPSQQFLTRFNGYGQVLVRSQS